MSLSEEQTAVVLAPLEGVTKVEAYAGAGKTSTLVALAQRHPRIRGLYLAFTKSAEMDAKQRFPHTVRCKTVHGLAFGIVGRLYGHKLGDLRPVHVIQLLDLPWDWSLAVMIAGTIEAWCASDLAEFPPQAIAIGTAPVGHAKVLAHAAQLASRLWDRMCDPRDPAPMTHDGYLKLYQLQHPTIDCHYLMVDEWQDTNPVTLDIVRRQRCPIVVVGDGYQSIFQFRGAVNAMQLLPATRTLAMTQSFRFGPEVARIANALLWGFFNESRPLVGTGYPTVVRRLRRPPEHLAILARTNAQVFHEAVCAVRAGKCLAFAGGIKAYCFDKILDAWHLSIKQPELVRDPFLRNFGTFAELERYAEDAADLEVQRLIKIVLAYQQEIPELIASIAQSTVSDLSQAGVVLSTAHRCKGLTLDVVQLADDFPALIDSSGRPLPPDKLDRQEVNLLYVAATRAVKRLALNPTTLDFLRAMGLDDLVRSHAAADPEDEPTWLSDLPDDDCDDVDAPPATALPIAQAPPQTFEVTRPSTSPARPAGPVQSDLFA
jgi:hypothetical protein